MFRINEPNKDLLEQILLIQCPTLLFPYVRQIIAETTTRGGYPPVYINPIDFYNFYVSKKQEQMQSEGSSNTNEEGEKKRAPATKKKTSTKKKKTH